MAPPPLDRTVFCTSPKYLNQGFGIAQRINGACLADGNFHTAIFIRASADRKMVLRP
jgi:hypothetical protein